MFLTKLQLNRVKPNTDGFCMSSPDSFFLSERIVLKSVTIRVNDIIIMKLIVSFCGNQFKRYFQYISSSFSLMLFFFPLLIIMSPDVSNSQLPTNLE